MYIYDISVPINNDLTVWLGDPPVSISQESFIERDGYNLNRLTISAHTGTHIDAPLHYIKDGPNIGSIELEQLIGPVLVIEIPQEIKIITGQVIESLNIPASTERILFKTENSKLWGRNTGFEKSYVGLDSSGAAAILKSKIKFVGMDYLSISILDDLVEPHKLLLSNKVVILESCNLSAVPAGEYQLVCLPLKVNEIEGAPVRAILLAKDAAL
jgi:arylformamidase